MAANPIKLENFLTEPRKAVTQVLSVNRVLALVTLLHVILVIGAVIGLAVDPRVITGQPAWLKPLKFGISITIYCFSFLWLLSYVQGYERVVRWLARVTAIGMVLESLVIFGQVLRGTTSHFNYTTPLDYTVFLVMGVTIAIVVSLSLVVALLLALRGTDAPVITRAIQIGLLLTVAGSFLAFRMAGPNEAQVTQLKAGQQPTAIGAHTIGVEDGGPGLPFVGWSTVGGDVRVPHFFGVHGIQFMILISWLLTRPGANARYSLRQQMRLVLTAGLGYAGLVAILFWQANRGQSVIAPDAATLAAFGALIGAVVLATVAIVSCRPVQTAAA